MKKKDIHTGEAFIHHFVQYLEKRAEESGYSVNENTKFSLLIGGNVKTSPSFRVFNYLLKIAGENVVYLPHEIFSEKELEEMTYLLRNSHRMIELVVSDPYKVSVMKYLDELSESSKRAQSVNNVVLTKELKLYGSMFDGEALIYWWYNILGETLDNKKIIHLGAGGVSRAFAEAVIRKASNIELVFTDIKEDPLNSLKEIVLSLSEDIKTKFIHVEHDKESGELNAELDNTSIIVNGTGLGKTKGNIYAYPRLDYKKTKGKACIDWNYRPSAKNLFLKYSEDNGAVVYNALGLLITGFYYTFHSISNKKKSFDYYKILKYAKDVCGFRDAIEADFEGDERLTKAIEKVSIWLPDLYKLSPAQVVKEIKHHIGRPEIPRIEEIIVILDYLFKYDRLFAKDVKNKMKDYFSLTGWEILSNALEYHLPQLQENSL